MTEPSASEYSRFKNTNNLSMEAMKEIFSLIKENFITPLVVGQRVLALHPKTKTLNTASLLTNNVESYHA